MKPSDHDAEAWIECINRDGRGLTVWEEEFVESVEQQVKRGRPLSEKQLDIFERIYAERT